MVFLKESESIIITNTQSKDLESICDMEYSNENNQFILPYQKSRHLEVIDSPDELHLSILEKESGDLVGFAIVAGLTDPSRSLELRRIVIQKKRLGYGRQCLQMIKTFCLETKMFSSLWLDVFDNNNIAINLYRSEGFAEATSKELVDQEGKIRTLLIFI